MVLVVETEFRGGNKGVEDKVILQPCRERSDKNKGHTPFHLYANLLIYLCAYTYAKSVSVVYVFGRMCTHICMSMCMPETD